MELPFDMIVAESQAVSARPVVSDVPRLHREQAVKAEVLRGAKGLFRLSQWLLVVADAAAVLLTTGIFFVSGWAALGSGTGSESILSLALLLMGALVFAGNYLSLVVHPALELQRTVVVVFAVFAAGAAGAYAFGQNPEAAQMVGAYGLFAVVLAPPVRLIARVLLGRTKWWGTPVAVLASGSEGVEVVDALRRWPEMGLRPVLLLKDDQSEIGLERGVWYDDMARAPSFAEQFGVKQAVMVMQGRSAHHRANELRRCAKFFDRIFVVSGEPGFGTVCAAVAPTSGLAGHVVRDARRDRPYQFMKRVADVCVASLLLVLLSPLFVIIGILIKLDSQGSVFYRQVRMGRDGVGYEVHKFRTMHLDAEARLGAILTEDPELHEQYRTYHKLSVDPRVTRIGRFLRSLSLDELPQLWNVIVGEMSLVGPRAYIPAEIADMQGLERVVLGVRPGITGLWQVSGRNALSFSERIQLDVHYVQSSSVWLDLYILARTLPVVLRGDGAS